MIKTLYILIDASGSMRGERADIVNIIMQILFKNVLENVRQEQQQAELMIKVSVLSFKEKDNLEWIIPKIHIENLIFDWYPLENNYFNGETPTGAAINAVIEDLEHGNYGEPDPEEVSPVILLISDGLPNGTNPTYEEALARIDPNHPNKSSKFRYSSRIAIGIDADDEVRTSLQQFGRIHNRLKEEGFKTYYDSYDAKEAFELIKLLLLGYHPV